MSWPAAEKPRAMSPGMGKVSDAWPSSFSSARSRPSWSRARPTRAACPLRCSTVCASSWQQTGRSSTSTSPAVPSIASIVRVPLLRRAPSRTGGAREWPVLLRLNTTASRRSPRPISPLTSGRSPCRLVMHGDDDQIVPIADSALLSIKLLERGSLKVYEKYPHGMCTTHADVINKDLLTFIRG